MDTETTGSFENEHEESLIDTTSAEGQAGSFELGISSQPLLGGHPDRVDDDEQDEDDEDPDDDALTSVSGKPRVQQPQQEAALEARSPQSLRQTSDPN